MSTEITRGELEAQLGKEVGVSDWIEITQGMIDTFADVTLDHQFIHIDPERAAKESPFGGTIAHGFLTLSLLSAFAIDALPSIKGTKMGVNYGTNKMRFLTPVKSGAKVRGRFALKEFSELKPGEITTIWDVTVEILGEAKPALVAEWINRRYLEAEA
ncbi:MAG: MaoC family dehydratase [Paracoccaceae bacterium]